MGKEADLVRHGAHLGMLREEADERAAVQRVDEPDSLSQLGHRVLAQRHVETCVHDHTRAGPVIALCGAGTAASTVELPHGTQLQGGGRSGGQRIRPSQR